METNQKLTVPDAFKNRFRVTISSVLHRAQAVISIFSFPFNIEFLIRCFLKTFCYHISHAKMLQLQKSNFFFR